MDPITLALLVAGIGALAGKIWQRIQKWVSQQRIPGGRAVLRRRLEAGQYRVVAGVFTPENQRIATNEWTTGHDSGLEEAFGQRSRIVIRYDG